METDRQTQNSVLCWPTTLRLKTCPEELLIGPVTLPYSKQTFLFTEVIDYEQLLGQGQDLVSFSVLGLCLTCTRLVNVVTVSVSSYVYPSRCVQMMLFPRNHSPPLSFTAFLPPLSHRLLGLEERASLNNSNNSNYPVQSSVLQSRKIKLIFAGKRRDLETIILNNLINQIQKGKYCFILYMDRSFICVCFNSNNHRSQVTSKGQLGRRATSEEGVIESYKEIQGKLEQKDKIRVGDQSRIREGGN